MSVYCIYRHTHIFVQIFLKDMGIFTFNPPCWMRRIFSQPSLTFSPPYLTSSQAPPPPQRFPHTGVTLLKWSSREGCSLSHSFPHSLDWMYCSLLALFLLWSLSCPERRNKGLEFTECLFLKSLYAFPTFFF